MASSFKSLRYTTAIAVSLVALSTANQANAQCSPAETAGNDTITCTGSITASQVFNSAGDDTVTIGVGDSIIRNNNLALQFRDTNGTATLINDGTIQITGNVSANDAVNFVFPSVTTNIVIQNTGSILNSSTSNTGGSGAIQVNGFNAFDTFSLTNSGTISSTRQAILFGGVGGGFVPIDYNSSIVINQTGGVIAAVGAVNDALFLGDGNDVITNEVGATIDGNINFAGGDDNFTNHGTLIDVTTLNLGDGNDVLTNSSLITADVALGNDDDVIANSGTITGRVLVTAGSDTITNSATGVIENVIAGPTNQNAIRITGGDLAGGIDNDGRITAVFNPAIAVSGTDVTGLIDNSGIIEGTEPLNAGVGIVVNANSSISGGITNQASGRISGTLFGLSVGGTNADISGQINNAGLIEGGGSFGFGSGVAVASSANISGGIVNSGTIDGMTNGIAVSSSADISGGITNQTGGTITGSAVGINVGFDSNISGGIDNSGTISATNASGTGVLVANGSNIGGGITNKSGGVISGGTTGSGIALGSGLNNNVSGGVTNEAGGLITGGGAGIFLDTVTANISSGVDNSGTISGTGVTGAGILVEGGANIGGGITNNVGGVITGLQEGILINANTNLSGAVINSGTIAGGVVGIAVNGNNNSIAGINNSGTIEGMGGVAIDLQDLGAATPITIAGGRIIGDVTDGNIASGFSPVTVTGSGFRTEGNFTVSDLMVDAGQDFTISSDNTVTLNDMTASDGKLIFELGASSDALLTVTGGDVDISDSIISIVNNNRSLSAGESILIATGIGVVNGGAGQALDDVTEEDFTFFDFEIADGLAGGVGTDNEVYLLVSSAANPCNGQFANNPNGPCKVLGDLTGTTNPELLSIINNVTGENAEEILEATLPQVDGSALAAAKNVTGNTLRLVSDRLTVIRGGGDGASGISSGDLTENLQMWGQVFGQKIKQGQRDSVAGYDATTRGVTIGADTDGLYDRATVGVAFSYADTNVGSKGANKTKSDIDSYNISLYGDYDLDDDTYLIGDLGYTYGDNESTRFAVGGVAGLDAASDYGSHQVEARVIAARDYSPTQYEGVRVTPKVQAHYVRYQNEDITESGAGGANLNVDSEALNSLEFGVGVDVRKDYVQDNGGILSPEISVGYRYDVIGDAVQTTSSFTGGGASFKTEGADPDQDTLNLGFGVGYTSPSSMEFTASYDYESKDEFDGHSAFLRAAMPF